MNFAKWKTDLLEGKTITVKVHGNSMMPLIKSGANLMIEPVTPDTPLDKGDVVFCKVKKGYYVHKIYQVTDGKYLIGNNRGHMNGWTTHIYGKVVL